MITKINSIKNFGLFQNYSHNAVLKDYNRYNLFYGWNGSGKTTLSSLFECLERKEQSQEYASIVSYVNDDKDKKIIDGQQGHKRK